MAHKKQHTNPVPPGNRPQAGPPNANDQAAQEAIEHADPTGVPGHEQDPKRRLGNYEGTGEAPYRQPGGLNDANH